MANDFRYFLRKSNKSELVGTRQDIKLLRSTLTQKFQQRSHNYYTFLTNVEYYSFRLRALEALTYLTLAKVKYVQIVECNNTSKPLAKKFNTAAGKIQKAKMVLLVH